jgi:16S rRNA (uracil1498-N3)-methyltransferase
MSARVFATADASFACGATLLLDADESHYLVRVRRFQEGMPVEVLDGHGRRAQATILSANARQTTLQVDREIPPSEASRRVQPNLCVAIPDAAALAEVVEIAMVLDVAQLVLVRTSYAQRLVTTPERFDKQMRAAMRQSGRADRLAIVGPIDLLPFLASTTPGLIAWEEKAGEDQPRLPIAPSPSLLVGPEGGFTSQEAKVALAHGWLAISLGPHVLRTPLAAAVGLTRVREASAISLGAKG